MDQRCAFPPNFLSVAGGRLCSLLFAFCFLLWLWTLDFGLWTMMGDKIVLMIGGGTNHPATSTHFIMIDTITLVATTVAFIIIVVVVRVATVLHDIRCRRHRRCRLQRWCREDCTATTNDDRISRRSTTSVSSSCNNKTMIILGSGGHTTEMLLLLQSLDPAGTTDDCNDYLKDVVYVIANSDTTSLSKLLTTMNEMENQQEDKRGVVVARSKQSASSNGKDCTSSASQRNLEIRHLPRARELHQSYFSSIFTTLYAFFQSVLLLWETKPQLILANGPGTCIPIVYAAFVMFRIFPCRRRRWWFHRHHHDEYCKIVYVESVCRVRTLSLSGKLVYPIVDSFVVHWPKLMETYDMAELCDALVPFS